MKFQGAKWLIAVIMSIIAGFVLASAILSVLMGCGAYNPFDDDDNETPSVQFTFVYADDIKSNPLFDTEEKRDAYKVQSLKELNELFDDFDKRFGFKPEHSIEIILSETVSFHSWKDVKNIAFTHEDYENGRVVNLSIHFPYHMFSLQWVRAHELFHAFVSAYHIPPWFNEGNAVVTENLYSDRASHPVVDLHTDIRLVDGVNAVNHWREGQGAWEDMELTLWCYSYSHSIIDYLEKTYPGFMAKFFDKAEPHTHLSTEDVVKILDEITGEDMEGFFRSLKFDL